MTNVEVVNTPKITAEYIETNLFAGKVTGLPQSEGKVCAASCGEHRGLKLNPEVIVKTEKISNKVKK